MKKKIFKLITVILLMSTAISATTVHAGTKFSDVKTGDWYCSSVVWVSENGLMCGYTDNIFAPNDELTRAQAAAIIHRMHDPSFEVEYKDVFADVKENDWYCSSVMWANKARIVYGYGDSFGAADLVTREQFVTMLYRYTTYLAETVDAKDKSVKHFSDSDKVNEYALIPMEWAYGYGLISGRADGRLDPQGYTTRAECASIIQRYVMEYNLKI